MRKCILIKTNLEISVVDLPDDDTFNDEVYKLLNCSCWEGVVNNFGLYMLVDENGKVSKPPKELNPIATLIYPGAGKDYIAGDVLISKIGRNAQGETDLVSLSVIEINSLQIALDQFVKLIQKIGGPTK